MPFSTTLHRERRVGIGGTGDVRLLVVDDDNDVRELIGEMLREAGFEVTLASSGETAISILDSGAEFEMMLADYAMPGMTGVTLIQAVSTRRPSMGSLLVTGYVEFVAAEALPPDRILRKPFTMDALIGRVRLLLSQPRRMP